MDVFSELFSVLGRADIPVLAGVVSLLAALVYSLVALGGQCRRK